MPPISQNARPSGPGSRKKNRDRKDRLKRMLRRDILWRGARTPSVPGKSGSHFSRSSYIQPVERAEGASSLLPSGFGDRFGCASAPPEPRGVSPLPAGGRGIAVPQEDLLLQEVLQAFRKLAVGGVRDPEIVFRGGEDQPPLASFLFWERPDEFAEIAELFRVVLFPFCDRAQHPGEERPVPGLLGHTERSDVPERSREAEWRQPPRKHRRRAMAGGPPSAKRGPACFFVRKQSFQAQKKRPRQSAPPLFRHWGRRKKANFAYIGARTRIPIDTEKINSKKRLFYALLPQSSAKINFFNPPCKIKPDFAVSEVVLLNQLYSHPA